MGRIASIVCCLSLAAGSVRTQAQDTVRHPERTRNTFSTEGWWKPAGPKFSPEVHDDRTITFRLRAPQAERVELLFDEWDVVPQTMQRDTGGIWSLTIGPVEPRIYQYKFRIDGLETVDPVNPDVKAGTTIYGSVVEVRGGEEPRFDERRRVGGEVHLLPYRSSSLGQLRTAWIYVPREAVEHPARRLPVLYLRHGGGDFEGSWVREGRVAAIMDNLIAEKAAVPMYVVMTNGLTDGSWAGGSTPEGIRLLERELIGDVIPLVENRYPVRRDKRCRAIAGLSMGGGQAFVIGLSNLDLCSAIGQCSAGFVSDGTFDYERYIPGVMEDPERINRELALLWIACGTKDPRHAGHLDTVEELHRRGVRCEFHDAPWGHEWQFWRLQLHDFAQRLFRNNHQ